MRPRPWPCCGRKRDAGDGVPPGQLRLASPYDTDARRAAKGDDLFWCGYKIHLTETCTTLPTGTGTGTAVEERVLPNLITDVHTTDATVPDVKATEPIQAKLADHGVKPAERYLDSGYPSADLITKAMKEGVRMVTPVLLDHSAQAKAADGFDKSAFTNKYALRAGVEGAESTSPTRLLRHGPQHHPSRRPLDRSPRPNPPQQQT